MLPDLIYVRIPRPLTNLRHFTPKTRCKLYKADPYPEPVDPGRREAGTTPKFTILVKNSLLINSWVLISNMTIAFPNSSP